MVKVMKGNSLVRAMLISVFALSAVGCNCVKKSEFDALKAEVDQNRRISEQALATAQDAKAQSQRLEEAVNRGFKRSMYK